MSSTDCLQLCGIQCSSLATQQESKLQLVSHLEMRSSSGVPEKSCEFDRPTHATFDISHVSCFMSILALCFCPPPVVGPANS